MSSILKNAAAASVIGHQPSTFYERDNRPNSLLQAFDQELKLFTAYMKKKSLPGYTKPEEESPSRPSSWLSELWNKYQPRLPPLFYEGKLLDIGEFLVSVKEYKVAQWQCFERYLQPYANIDIEQTPDASTFVATYFPNGLKNENAVLMSRALLGKFMCMFHVEKQNDPRFQSKKSIDKCLHILAFLRLITQILLPREYLCWLVYNGTIHIYTIARHLMVLGHSAVVLEYLLWASMCMETSVPLLTAKYLSWRATLYTAVCQCYYDCMAGEHAENFARRGLTKIHELSNLEMTSSVKNMAAYEDSFRSATIRMASMVFKRAVFETRRKPKGLLRPKTRANLKDTLHLPWPRTPTETMLAEMFEGGSAQFLAILESLSNSNVRILQTSAPASESEPEILDVYSELMMAAQEILAGGGGNRPPSGKSHMVTGTQSLAGVTCQGSLIQMATKGEDNVPLESVIRLVKFAYAYEQFDVFDALLGPVMAMIKESKDERFHWNEKALELLSAMGKLNSSRKQKKLTPNIEEEDMDKVASSVQGKKSKPKRKSQEKPIEKPPEPEAPVNYGDDMIQVADVLLSIVTGSYQNREVEIDLVVDATLFLWNKCKSVLQKFQTGSTDNPRFLQKMENPSKEADVATRVTLTNAGDNEWIYLLDAVHRLVSWSGISNIDPTLAAEVSLRLALVYESSAVEVTMSAKRDSRATASDFDAASEGSNLNITISAQSSPSTTLSQREQLLRAKETAQVGLLNVNCARRTMAVSDQENIVDIQCMKELYPEMSISGLPKDTPEDKDGSTNTTLFLSKALKKKTTTLCNITRDLHVELVLVYHRVCLKLSALGSDTSSRLNRKKSKQNKMDKKENQTQNATENVGDFSELCSQCKKNSVSKALLLAQRAVMLGSEQEPKSEQKKLLEDAVNLVHRIQVEEKKMFLNNSDPTEQTKRRQVPPAPILICRTDTFMIFKPAPFEPESGEKVAWYRIFARSISQLNVTVRLSDNCFPGTGEEIPPFNCVMKVSNLVPNERYVFALAAYTANGKLIGDHIGETTKSFLASHPLPVLTTWAFVCQMAYQSGCYSQANQAFNVLWDSFVMKPRTPSDATYITSAKKDFKVSLLRLNKGVVDLSSPILLRLFLASIFINSDIAVKEGQLFCDAVCEQGIFYDRQRQRLQQCERLLVAIELACWLNETSLVLQTVVQIYGLLAPMLYHKIPLTSAVQILHRCHAALKEIPQDLINKRQSSVSDSLRHMVTCSTYYVAKGLKSLGQYDMATGTVEIGRYLLGSDADAKLAEERGGGSDEQREGTGKHGKVSKKQTNQEANESAANESLMALEALLMGKCEGIDSDLLGNEDPKVVHAHISCLPSAVAFKEVEKFKSKPNYMELLVCVSQKGLAEGLTDLVLQWTGDGIKFLTKRIVDNFGNLFYVKKPQIVTGIETRKFAAAMVEYKKDGKVSKAEKPTSRSKSAEKKRNKQKTLPVSGSVSETVKQQQQEEERKAAIITLSQFSLLDACKAWVGKTKWRRMVTSDIPWRSQMNIIQGLCHFNPLLGKIKHREKMIGASVKRTNYLDHEWFTLETVGVMVAGWDGGPSKSMPGLDSVSRVDELEFEQIQLYRRMVEKLTPVPIQFAAAEVIEPGAAAAGAKSQEPDETPRSQKSLQESKYESDILTAGATMKILKNVFTCFRRAMILAHRGKRWTLLQNACRTVWNCAHTVLLRTCAVDHSFGDHGLLTIDLLQLILWQPFYIASDCLLNMMAILQASTEKQISRNKSKGKPLVNPFESLMGTTHSERGGASLKFDPLLDDASLVDTRFIRRLVLRTLELLYSQHKWEKLVDIALRFNALTNNRYAEQVLPLVVHAQILLEARIKEAGGEAPPQSHIRNLQAQLGHVIQAKDYLRAQLKVQINKETAALNETVAAADAVNKNMYTPQDAYHLSVVPINTEVSLRELNDSVDQVHYTARALQHSRKLLCLYLAGEQNLVEGHLDPRSAHVDFKLFTQQPLPQMPPKKITLDFSNSDDVQLCPLRQSYLSTIISSYEKTIEMLLGKNMKDLAAQAMHELGNICFHAQNTRAALKWWSQSLDLVLNTSDAVHTWRTSVSNVKDVSSTLLGKCGLWGCLMAGVVASNIAQYIMSENSGSSIECCLLSGFLFKALFRSTMPHPTADRDYALYIIGEGAEVTTLTPGIDFMSERFRCDGRQLLGALKWLTEELSRAQYNLFVLPLLTLHQYFCSNVCQDVEQTVSSRILRVRVLADLGLYAEAFTVIQQLLNGEYLIQPGDSNFRSKEGKRSLVYNSSKSLTDAQNQRIIENLMDKRLPQNLSTLYGPYLTCCLTLVKAHLLLNLTNTLPFITNKMDDAPKVTNERQDSKPEIQKRKSAAHSKTTVNVPDSEDNTDFSLGLRSESLKGIKSSIIASTEQIITAMMNVILEKSVEETQGTDALSAAELELVVQCQLELTRIAQQRHQAYMAAQTVLGAMKMLQSSKIFKSFKHEHSRNSRPPSLKKSSTTKSLEIRLTELMHTHQYENLQARVRLDSRLWLQCRCELITSLLMEIRGLGDIIDTGYKIVPNLAECRQYLVEGLGEAEVWGNIEMQAQFFFLGAQLNIIEGKSLQHTTSLLEDAIGLLNKIAQRSDSGHLLLATCMVLKADLEAILKSGRSSETLTQDTLKAYVDAQKIVLKQMELLGERIEHSCSNKEYLSTSVSPLTSFYLPQYQRLVQIKLRIGHAIARNCAKMIKYRNIPGSTPLLWADSLAVLSAALVINQNNVSKDLYLEAEILFVMGKVQKMMVYLKMFEAKEAANTLFKAIKASSNSSQDLGLMRQAYLEMALIYFYSTGLMTVTEDLHLDPAIESQLPVLDPESKRVSEIISQEEKKQIDEEEAEKEKEKKVIRLAIACAAAVAQAQWSRDQITGDILVITQRLESKAVSSMPDFLYMDLLVRNVLGKKQYNNTTDSVAEIIRFLAEPQEEVKGKETYDSQVTKVKNSAKNLKWMHILGYQTILKRLVSTTSAAMFGHQTSNGTKEKDKDSEINLQPTSHAGFNAGTNHDVVRYMLLSTALQIRLMSLHTFLFTNLKTYEEMCCAPSPPADLCLATQSPTLVDFKGTIKHVSSYAFGVEREIKSTPYLSKATLAPGMSSDEKKPDDQMSLEGGCQLAVQWYQPGLEEDGSSTSAADVNEKRILLLYALTSKEVKPVQGFKWVSLQKLCDLHDRLLLLVQKADMHVMVKKNYAAGHESSHPSKVSIAKLDQEDQLEVVFRKCLDDVWVLLKGKPQHNIETLPEFNVDNVKKCERLLDPSTGLLLKGVELLPFLPWLCELFT